MNYKQFTQYITSDLFSTYPKSVCYRIRHLIPYSDAEHLISSQKYREYIQQSIALKFARKIVLDKKKRLEPTYDEDLGGLVYEMEMYAFTKDEMKELIEYISYEATRLIK